MDSKDCADRAEHQYFSTAYTAERPLWAARKMGRNADGYELTCDESPSQSRNVPSTLASCSGLSAPRKRRNFAEGTERIPWASKPPGLRKLTGTMHSKRVPR